MKIAKILAGMAASAIAMSTFAMVSTPASAAEAASGHAGLQFQSNDTWNFRNEFDNETHPAFPDMSVGVQGGAYGLDTNANFGDCDINGDGTYTVTMATSGTITEQNPTVAGTADDKWVADEASGITREGSKWSILHNFEPVTNDGSETLTRDNLSWGAGKDAKVFNILSVSTDIIVTYNADGDATPEDKLDKPTFNGNVIEVTDFVVNIQGQEYTPEDGVKFSFDDKKDLDPDAPGIQNYLAINIINKYQESTIDKKAFVTEEDGEISCTFTVTGLAATDDSSSQADSSSAADSSSTTSSSSSSSSSGSTSSTKSTTSTAKTTTTTTTTTTSTASAASDSTDNAASGAPAGIALALAAVAGAAVVVSRKK